MDFSAALQELKCKKKVTRAKWKWERTWLELVTPELLMPGVKNPRVPSDIYLHYPPGRVYPAGTRAVWRVSHEDLLSDDWLIVE